MLLCQYQPTSEEARYIIQLEKAINSALGNSDSFDVADEYDLLEEESTGGPTKSTTAPTTVPITRVTKQPTLNPITVQPTEILHLQPVQLAPIRQSRRFSRQTKLREYKKFVTFCLL